MPTPPLVVGAAFDLASLVAHREWLLERQRDIELQHFISPAVLCGDWRPEAARVREALAGWTGRLGLHGPFVGFALDAADPDVGAVVRRRLDQALDVAAELAASQLVVHSPFRTWDHHNLDAIDGARATLVSRVHANLEAAVGRAETLGVEIVIENIEDMDPTARVDLARSFGSPAVRVSLDTGHANYAHHATGAPPVDFHVRAAGDWLAHVHLQDSDGYADRHWPPGEGNIPWHAVFGALAVLDRPPRLILELKDHEQVRGAAAWLESQRLAS